MPRSFGRSVPALVTLVVFVAVLSFVGTAHAIPCGTGLDTTNVTFRGVASDDCVGPQDTSGGDNLNASDLPIVISEFGSEPFTSFLSEGGSVTIGDVTFTLSVDATGQTSGSWTLSFTSDPSTTIVQDLGVILKASDANAVYFFDNESFTTDGSGEGTFQIAFTNNGGQLPGLSGLHLLFRDGTPTNGVPEPATMLLLGAGLLGTTLFARRRAR